MTYYVTNCPNVIECLLGQYSLPFPPYVADCRSASCLLPYYCQDRLLTSRYYGSRQQNGGWLWDWKNICNKTLLLKMFTSHIQVFHTFFNCLKLNKTLFKTFTFLIMFELITVKTTFYPILERGSTVLLLLLRHAQGTAS